MDGFTAAHCNSSCVVSSGPFHIHQPSRGSVRVWVRHGGHNLFLPLCGKQGPLHLWMGAIQDRVSAIRRPQPMSCQMYASPKPVVEWVTFWVGQIFMQVSTLVFSQMQCSLLWIECLRGGSHHATPGSRFWRNPEKFSHPFRGRKVCTSVLHSDEGMFLKI